MLPKFGTANEELNLLQTTWAKQLDPLLRLPLNQSLLLKNVPLAVGANVVNHLLGRKLQGWTVVRLRAAAAIYDTQDSNPIPNLTLNLSSSAAVVVDLLVF